MKNILKIGIISFAFGLIFLTAGTADAQNRHAAREYRKDVRDAQKDYYKDIRKGKNPYKAAREYNNDVRDARRDYIRDVRRGNNGWYYYQNNRRFYRPFATWTFNNGRFYRRY